MIIAGQRGSVLISVTIGLVILAAIAHLLNVKQAFDAHALARVRDKAVATALAEAGLRDALLRARRSTSGSYPPQVQGSLPGSGVYKAVINVPDSTKPSQLTIAAEGVSPSGTKARLQRDYLICAAGADPVLVPFYSPPEGKPVNLTESDQFDNAFIFLDEWPGASWRNVMKFDEKAISGPIKSAVLLLDVHQFDPEMEGATIYASRLRQAYTSKGVSWKDAAGRNKPWKNGTELTPGGNFTSVDEGTATVRATIQTYRIDITSMVEGWMQSRYSDGNSGLILRTNRSNGGVNQPFRLTNARLEVTPC